MQRRLLFCETQVSACLKLVVPFFESMVGNLLLLAQCRITPADIPTRSLHINDWTTSSATEPTELFAGFAADFANMRVTSRYTAIDKQTDFG